MLPSEPQGDIGFRPGHGPGRMSGTQKVDIESFRLRTWPSLAVCRRQTKGTAGVRGRKWKLMYADVLMATTGTSADWASLLALETI